MFLDVCIYLAVTLREKRELFSALVPVAVFFLFMPGEVFAHTPFSGYDDGLFKKACSGILKYQDGSGSDGLGSLLTAVAGMGAIISAAVGGFRVAWALLVVSVGTYILGDFIRSPFGYSGKC